MQPVLSQQPLKRMIYLGMTTLLGIMVSYLAHAIIEIWYLDWALKNGKPITWTYHFGKGLCALVPGVHYGLFALGAVGGYFLGVMWWKWVYVEGKRWKRGQH